MANPNRYDMVADRLTESALVEIGLEYEAVKFIKEEGCTECYLVRVRGRHVGSVQLIHNGNWWRASDIHSGIFSPYTYQHTRFAAASCLPAVRALLLEFNYAPRQVF